MAMDFSRHINVLCVVIFALLATTIAQQCTTGLKDQVIVAEPGSISKVDAFGKSREVLTKSAKQVYSLDFDYHRNILYWTDIETTEIYALDQGASKPRLVVTQQRNWLPLDIAVDSVTEKLYVSDGFSGTAIWIIDLKNSSKKAIAVSKDLHEIRSFGMDVNAGYLFINDMNQILRTDLDGLNAKVLFERGPKNETFPVFRILVDSAGKRLYWYDIVAHSVVSSDYEGADRKIVFHTDGNPNGDYFGSMALLENHLYWSDVEKNVIYEIDIQSGKVSNILNSEATALKSIVCPTTHIDNPCAQNKCEQFCVLSKANKANQRCICEVGYELAENQVSCIKIQDFVLFTQDTFLRGQRFSTDGKAADAINPSGSPVGQSAVIDYNAEARIVYHSGVTPDNHLVQTSLDSGDQIALYPNILSQDVHYLAYDWASKNLYYFTYYYSDQVTLSVLNVNNPTYSKIIVDDVKIPVLGVAVHPHEGYVYFLQCDDVSSRIVRTNSDGSDLKIVVDLGKAVSIDGLTIDLEANRLYWSQFKRLDNTTSLQNSNLDGGDILSENLPEKLDLAEVAVNKDHIYAINDLHTQLLRLNKKNLNEKVVLVQNNYLGTLSGLKLVNSQMQAVKPDHPCVAGKHQCQKFCFVVKGKGICGCPYGEKLDADGKTCIDNSKAEPPFKPCVDKTSKCNKETGPPKSQSF